MFVLTRRQQGAIGFHLVVAIHFSAYDFVFRRSAYNCQACDFAVGDGRPSGDTGLAPTATTPCLVTVDCVSDGILAFEVLCIGARLAVCGSIQGAFSSTAA